jgi:hypothetical protein
LGLKGSLLFWGAQAEIAPFLSGRYGEKLRMQTKFLDVT